VTIIAATNLPWMIDPGVLRRMEKRIYVPLPKRTGIEKLYKINVANLKLEEKIDWDKIY
jgi:katanin p60 ATPase-containing subunit A1